MKFKITRVAATGTEDLAVTADVTATVGALAARLGSGSGSGSDSGSGRQAWQSRDDRRQELTLRVEPPGATQGIVLDPAAPVHESSLRSGCRVEVVPLGERRPGDERDDTPVALVRVTGGPGAGREFRIAAGVNLVGRDPAAAVYLDADPEVSRRHATVTVAETISVTDLNSANGVLVDGRLVRRSPVTGTSRIRVGATELAIVPLRGGCGSRPSAAGDAFVRPPRVQPVFSGSRVAVPEPPTPEDRPRLPVVALAAPVVMGAALLLVTHQPMTLMFAILSPVMLIGSWLDSRLRGRRRRSARRRAFDEGLVAARRELQVEREREAAARGAESPTTSTVAEAMRLRSPLLWSQHPHHDTFLRLRLGSGTRPSRSAVILPARGGGEAADWETLQRLAEEFAEVPRVPVTVRLDREGAIGVAGGGPMAAAAARALVVQAAGLHSPAELTVAAFVGEATRGQWEWLTWLPHVDSPHSPLAGTRTLVADEASADLLLSALEHLVAGRARRGGVDAAAPAPPVVLVIVGPGAPADRARLAALANDGGAVVVLWTAREVADLPAACGAFLDVDEASGTATAGFVRAALSVRLHEVETIDAIGAENAARALAAVTDAGARAVDGTDLPKQVALLELYGTGPHDGKGATDPSAILRRWRRNDSLVASWTRGLPRDPGGLRAVVGQSHDGPFALDLRADGPHALVGGTTGSGKSEFLQSWIMALAAEYAPDRLTFLLVDYKGGAAFAECAELPHTVGLVTDLTPPLVRRALVSLRAELTRRERILGRAAAKDVTTMEGAGDPEAPPALVIVIDEFAALASEVPEFVDGVVDIAQRGRSLGLHLVLATQRPSGVITESLRANMSLRVALRMADDADSVDVVGVPDAARFDRETPGRAIAARGAGRLQDFQAGYLGGRTESSGSTPVVAIQTLTFGPGEEWGGPATGGAEVAVPHGARDVERRDRRRRDLERLARSIAGAADRAGVALPRRPWLDQLPAAIDLSALPQASPGALALGLRDEPHHQRQRALAVDLDAVGNVLVVGGGGAGASSALRTVAAVLTQSAAAQAEAAQAFDGIEIYGLDFAGGGLAVLETLPTVGSVVVGSDLERVDRLLRDLAMRVERQSGLLAAGQHGPSSDHRVQATATSSRVVLLLDGFSVFRAENEFRDAGRSFDRLQSIAAAGRKVGVHVVLSTDRAEAIPSSLSARIGARILLQGSERAGGFDAETRTAGAIGPPGRGWHDGDPVQLAVPGGSADTAVQNRALERLAHRAEQAGVREVAPVRRLGDHIARSELPDSVDGRPTIGVGDETLEPVGMPLGGVFVISGPFGSGRTTAMITTAHAVLAARPETEPYLLSARAGRLTDALDWSGHALTPEDVSTLATRLISRLDRATVAETARLLVVIEGVGDFEGHPAEALAARLVKTARRAGAAVIAEADPVTAPTAWQLFAELKTARAGLLLQPEESDGISLFRTALPRLPRTAFPPGRGFLVDSGRLTCLQVAVTNAT